MAIRNLGQVITDSLSFIRSRIPQLSLLVGTVARDVVVESPAQEFNRIYVELARVRSQSLLNDPSVFEDDELDNLADGIGLARSLGTAATGLVTFRLRNFSTASTDITIPSGTEVSTRTSLSSSTTISFNTTADRTFVASQANFYFNPVTGFFELSAPIQASSPGLTGNVASGTITTMVSSISGSPTVINSSPTIGGTDSETDESFLDRVRLKLSGNNVGTSSGLLSLINANPNVQDVLLLQPGDVDLTRDVYGNAADVVILGEILTSHSEVRMFISGTTQYVLSFQPVSSADLVDDIIVGVSAGGSFNFVKDTHFIVVVDNNTLTRGTTAARSRIAFIGGPFPDNGTTFTVTYSNNSLVSTLQSTINEEDNKLIGSDVQVREATEILVKVSATIQTFPGFTKVDVATAVADNVSNYLNTLPLGEDIDNSDISGVIQSTDGVDSVDTPVTLQAKRPTDSDFVSYEDIEISRTEYGRADTSLGAITIT